MDAVKQLNTPALTCEESLQTALHFIDIAREELRRAPTSIKQSAMAMRDEVESFKLSLRDELLEAVDEEGDWCSECPYCVSHRASRFDPPLRECNGSASDCIGVIEIMGPQ